MTTSLSNNLNKPKTETRYLILRILPIYRNTLNRNINNNTISSMPIFPTIKTCRFICFRSSRNTSRTMHYPSIVLEMEKQKFKIYANLDLQDHKPTPYKKAVFLLYEYRESKTKQLRGLHHSVCPPK